MSLEDRLAPAVVSDGGTAILNITLGAGENLAAGTNLVRLGTDALNYAPGQKIKMMARLIDEQYRPLADADVRVNIFRGNEQVAQMPLSYQSNSHGMYVAEIDSLTTEGVYRLELAGRDVENLLAKENGSKVQQNISVAIDSNPVELGETGVDRELANRIASLSGGQTAGMADVDRLTTLFGPPSKVVVERHETKLWDNWIVMVIAVGAITGEWILRRRAGIA